MPGTTDSRSSANAGRAEYRSSGSKLRKAAALGLHSSDYALVIVSLSHHGSIGRLLWLSNTRQDEHVRGVVEEIWLQASRNFNPPEEVSQP